MKSTIWNDVVFPEIWYIMLQLILFWNLPKKQCNAPEIFVESAWRSGSAVWECHQWRVEQQLPKTQLIMTHMVHYYALYLKKNCRIIQWRLRCIPKDSYSYFYFTLTFKDSYSYFCVCPKQHKWSDEAGKHGEHRHSCFQLSLQLCKITDKNQNYIKFVVKFDKLNNIPWGVISGATEMWKHFQIRPSHIW